MKSRSTVQILAVLHKLAGKEKIYIVGGWLRDSILKKASRDLDIACAKDPLGFAKKTASALKGRLVVLDKTNKIYRVVLKGDPSLDYIDIAKFRESSIENDLLSRDFTVNSMALLVDGKTVDLKNIIDPANGRKDLSLKIIRMTSPAAFKDDPLRLLRAFRFAAELDAKIEPKTLKAVKACSKLLSKAAGERIREEFFRILSIEHSCKWIEAVEAAGLLDVILPDSVAMKSSAKKFYLHPKGLWQHCMETLNSFEDICLNLKRYFPENESALKEHLKEQLSSGITRYNLLKIVCILHDAAKPACAKRDGKKMRFLGHEKEGAKLLVKTLQKLRLGRSDIKIAAKLVEHHMRPISLTQASILTQRASFRFFRALEQDTPYFLLLALSDWHSYKRLKSHKPAELKKQERTIRELFVRYFTERSKPVQEKLVDGNILMKELGLEPGPVIGKLIALINEAQQLGKVTSKKQALELASKKLTQLKK